MTRVGEGFHDWREENFGMTLRRKKVTQEEEEEEEEKEEVGEDGDNEVEDIEV